VTVGRILRGSVSLLFALIEGEPSEARRATPWCAAQTMPVCPARARQYAAFLSSAARDLRSATLLLSQQ
jgi:hypothetical protein